MLQETQTIIHRSLDFLPIKSYANIHEGNALNIDWQTVAPNVDFIIGNPPFVGKSFQTAAQKADMKKIFAGVKGCGNLDYVACWFKKTADFIRGTKTACAFVATNSIVQGVAIPPMWTYLFNRGVKVNFAYQTFKWFSESFDMASVHCVIVGFANFDAPVKKIFDGDTVAVVPFINAYLLGGSNVIVLPHALPLRDDVPIMINGSTPVDNGNLIIEAEKNGFVVTSAPTSLSTISCAIICG